MPLRLAEIRKWSPEKRREELKKLRMMLMGLLARKSRGALKETAKIKQTKKDIARILTVMRELGEV